jgi:hypothetical protein
MLPVELVTSGDIRRVPVPLLVGRHSGQIVIAHFASFGE